MPKHSQTTPTTSAHEGVDLRSVFLREIGYTHVEDRGTGLHVIHERQVGGHTRLEDYTIILTTASSRRSSRGIHLACGERCDIIIIPNALKLPQVRIATFRGIEQEP